MNIKQHIWVPGERELDSQRGWILEEIDRIGEDMLIKLIKEAARVRANAYQPYSKYSVGAALLCISGNIYASCNAETVSYTETDHAERSVITKAISEGEIAKRDRRFIRAIAISGATDCTPCGGCRQRIMEHADNALILAVDEQERIKKITSLAILLPAAFTPAHLGI